MSTLSPAQIATIGRSAGFSGDGLVMLIAICEVESRGQTDALNINSDGSRDRGIGQINDKWHPDVSDACAFDPTCAIKAMYQFTQGGTDWSAYQPDITYGRVNQFWAEAQAAASSSGVTPATTSAGADATAGIPLATSGPNAGRGLLLLGLVAVALLLAG